MTNTRSIFKTIFTQYIFFEIYIMGIISGLPYSLMYTAMVMWLGEVGVPIHVASSFAWVRMPYAFKYLWSPFIDYIKLPVLYKLFGRRRSWMILTSIVNILVLISINSLSIVDDVAQIWYLCLVFGFSAATYDISYDALRIEKLDEEDQAIGVAVAGLGYKLGSYISGAGILILVSLGGSWEHALYILSGLFAIGIVFIMTVSNSNVENPAKNFVEAVKDPLLDIWKKEDIVWIILFLLTFKGGQAMLNFMCGLFYRSLGYSLGDITLVVKTFGIFMTMLGTIIGAVVVRKIGIYRGVLYCGLFQAVTDFSFIWLHYQNGAIWALYVNIILENVSGAMASCAMVSLISTLCNKQFAGSHFAILSSFAVMMNSTISGFSGGIVRDFGWDVFFFIDFAISIPPLFIAAYLVRKHGLNTHPIPYSKVS